MRAGGEAIRDVAAPSDIASLLTEAARRYPTRPALVHGDVVLTYGELDVAVDRLVARLRDLEGALAGRRVAILAPNVPALVLSLFAAYRAGAVAVPLSARLREHEIRGALEDAHPTLVLSVSSYGGYSFAELGEVLARELPTRWLVMRDDGAIGDALGPGAEPSEPLDGSTAAILYTSGTTGRPKGALVAHASELAAARFLPPLLRLQPADAMLLVVPVTHRFGYTCLHAAVASGAAAILADAGASVRPLLQELERGRASVLHGSPSLFASVLKTRRSVLHGLRTGFVAGTECPGELLEELDRIGVRVLNLYGSTEAGAVASCRPDDPPETRYTTVGRPLPGIEVRVDDRGDGGELQVRGSTVTAGYYAQPEQTAAAFEDGWFRTGDIASIGDDGRVRISGRRREVVHVGGFNVYPAEVEGALLTHPDVDRAVVVGVPHAQLGETLEAYVVPRPAANVTQVGLVGFARERIAGYKVPYAIHIVDELPTLVSGKPDRRALLARSKTPQEGARV